MARISVQTLLESLIREVILESPKKKDKKKDKEKKTDFLKTTEEVVAAINKFSHHLGQFVVDRVNAEIPGTPVHLDDYTGTILIHDSPSVKRTEKYVHPSLGYSGMTLGLIAEPQNVSDLKDAHAINVLVPDLIAEYFDKAELDFDYQIVGHTSSWQLFRKARGGQPEQYTVWWGWNFTEGFVTWSNLIRFEKFILTTILPNPELDWRPNEHLPEDDYSL